jgi:hypothetical protein
MAEQEYPTLNEVAPSWADLKLAFSLHEAGTVKLVDVAAVKWSDKVERGVMRGTNGGRKTKRTSGQYDCEASITFYKAGWRTFQAALAEVNPQIAKVGFDVIIQHTPAGTDEIFTVKIVGCLISGRGGDHKEGTDPDQVEVPLDCMLIEDDGVTLL